ncbi:DUF881 domain-containing protein [Pimelobacter simplex]|uniref:Uncharacterized protein n=1 Tax=Nocardioides simplex TaxID=2045 RepID=A0A0A1DJB7_NOCSI|nr:DUF881 domain-containing protein [Pimelobacter simplex]AIY17419.1 hypothetical protein KR76_12825 [Pimelobacter simplex]MCG8149763.1 DUF881 domain-containing protein [Pimelobacter simplex]GEB14029.1 membrane protein [Pimelobacter simplex]SFM64951.1 Uncharacterized conserved protein YlxW, UPF0749 family [Pimelobacter simplex]
MTEPSLDRARTPLLTLITQEALDRDYQVAASRRGDGERPERRRSYRGGVIVVIGVFAMLVTVAAVQTSQNADVDDASRASLIDRVEARQAVLRDNQDRIAQLRDANAQGQELLSSLNRRYADARARVAALGALTGFAPVTGSGVRIVVDNPDYAGPNEVVRDSDLALLVNGLWEAGAEAISINGQRLSGASAIRNSGEPIEVNSVGIAPPYTVIAIGDRRTLGADFVESRSGLRFLNLADQYGFTHEIDNVDDVRLGAAPSGFQRLRSATYLQRNPKTKGGEAP